MAIQGYGYEVGGITVGGAGPVKNAIHLALDEGVFALYGLNGAGKTWLLRQAVFALSGDTGRGKTFADLHLRVLNPQAHPTGKVVTAVADALKHAIAEQRGTMFAAENFDEYEILDLEYRGTDRNSIREQLQTLIDLKVDAGRMPDEISEFYSDAANQGRFTLQATSAGTWSLWLAASATEGITHPAILESVSEEFAQLISDLDQVEADRIKKVVFENEKLPARSIMYYCYPSRVGRAKSSYAAHTRWPEWLQIPILHITDGFTTAPVNILGSVEEPDAADADTLKLILSVSNRPSKKLAIQDLHDGNPIFDETIVGKLKQTEEKANALYRDVLNDAPSLRFNMRTPHEWLLGDQPTWEVVTSKSLESHPLAALSNAQLRWAQLAIGLAISEPEQIPVVFICDEPERGLHKLAERQMPFGLKALAERIGMTVLAATHSSYVLNSRQVDAIRVFRDSRGDTDIRPISYSLVDRKSAEQQSAELGLSFADLLLLMKVAVVVEGLHDEIVFKHILKRQLDHAAANILPMHGGTGTASLAEARFLFDTTDADIVVVLDNLNQQAVQSIWERTKLFADEGRLDEARAEAGRLRKLARTLKSSEMKYLHNLAVLALDLNRLDRIHIFGLSCPDVICYLPEREILHKHDRTWDELIAEWTTAAAPDVPSNLKKWLGGRGLIPDDENDLNAAIERAAVAARRQAMPVHNDLTDLGDRILRLSGYSDS